MRILQQMVETLKEDRNRHLIGGEWAEGEKERLTKGLRFLTDGDVALFKSRLESGGRTSLPRSCSRIWRIPMPGSEPGPAIKDGRYLGLARHPYPFIEPFDEVCRAITL